MHFFRFTCSTLHKRVKTQGNKLIINKEQAKRNKNKLKKLTFKTFKVLVMVGPQEEFSDLGHKDQVEEWRSHNNLD